MQYKKWDIEEAKRHIGWAYKELRWLTEKQAEQATRKRNKLLKSISDRAEYSFNGSKVSCGDLSPGCITCGQGVWSCMFINGLCTANCFFCPQDRKMKKERSPMTGEGIEFDDPEDYIDYLEKFGFKGVGFSGGESMLVMDKLLLYIRKIRERFGNAIYIWIYTNGDVSDPAKLKKLKEAGLDEIRFNISARNYDLRQVELATDFIKKVTVEVPAIPEDYELLKNCLLKMRKIGVDYLNLHQLLTTKYNFRNYIKRNYTFLHYLGIPILESEITALKLIKYASDNSIKLKINYCSQVYKNRFQGKGHRIRAVALAKEDFEGITKSGYIRRLSIKNRRAGTETFIQHSHLKDIDLKDCNLIIDYFDPQLKAETGHDVNCKEIRLNSKKKAFVDRIHVGRQKELSPIGIESFRNLFIENMDSSDVMKYFFENYKSESINDMKKEAEILLALMAWEEVESGFPEIY